MCKSGGKRRIEWNGMGMASGEEDGPVLVSISGLLGLLRVARLGCL